MDEEGPPLWARILIAAHLWLGGAAIGGIMGASWGSALTGLIVATPLAMLALFVPGVLLALCTVLSLFSCAG